MSRPIILTLLLILPAPQLLATSVEPMMGGGQVSEGEAGMKHADISFERGVLSVAIDPTVDTPVLRPLDAGLEFDPAGTWAMLQHDAYNFQYGWNPSRFDAYPPVGSWIWIELLDASPGLKTYQRPPADPEGMPIFGTGGSSMRWRWGGTMTHNLYAVTSPASSDYFATYRVYIGYDSSGEVNPNFAPAEVTFEFLAAPQLTGDYNNDGLVNLADYTVWRDHLGAPAGVLANDPSGEPVGTLQYENWKANFGASIAASGAMSAAIPEPASWLLGVLGCVAARLVCAFARF